MRGGSSARWKARGEFGYCSTETETLDPLELVELPSLRCGSRGIVHGRRQLKIQVLGHLHPNRPSDQLSWRTPCRTLVHETRSPSRLSAVAAYSLAHEPAPDSDALANPSNNPRSSFPPL